MKDKEKLEEGFYKETINDETLTKANALLVIKCANLEQQAKKQKEVNDRIKEYILRSEVNSIGTPFACTQRGKDLLNILNEASK